MQLRVFAFEPFDYISPAVQLPLIVDFLEILRQQFVDQSGMPGQIALQQVEFQALDDSGQCIDFHFWII